MLNTEAAHSIELEDAGAMAAGNDNEQKGGAPELPLVLITISSRDGEFESLYQHLEAVEQESEPTAQRLIVATGDLPDMLYHVLRQRTDGLPNVHLRRLRGDRDEIEERKHSTGTFYVPVRHRTQED